METSKQLLRSSSNKMLAGVCAGIAKYLNADPTVVRVVFAIGAILTSGMPVLAYAVMAVIMPVDHEDEF
jgi:phage shock protein C